MLQDARASASDPAVICSFDYEAIDKPTRAIIHQAARFLYVKRGRGKLVIDGEEYVLQPNTLVAITPWKITDTVEVTETLQFIKVIYDYSYLNSVFKSVLGSGDASAEPLRFLTVEPVAYLDSVQAGMWTASWSISRRSSAWNPRASSRRTSRFRSSIRSTSSSI